MILVQLQVFCPHVGSAVLKGLMSLALQKNGQPKNGIPYRSMRPR